VSSLEKAGFRVAEAYDVNLEALKTGSPVPWYATLQGAVSLSAPSQLKHSRVGRQLTQTMIDVLETLRVAPAGTSDAHKMLCRGADNLVRGGELGIFTPMFYFKAVKPAQQ